MRGRAGPDGDLEKIARAPQVVDGGGGGGDVDIILI